jgi:hypothetical protein
MSTSYSTVTIKHTHLYTPCGRLLRIGGAHLAAACHGT